LDKAVCFGISFSNNQLMTKAVHYRKANLSDVRKLSVLYKTVYIQTYGREGVSDEFANFITKQFSEERLSSLIQNHPDNLVVAEYSNNLVGVAEIEFDKKSPVGNLFAPELNKLYILDWFCGMGIGNQLLKHCEDIVRMHGQTILWLWVLISNERAISFYQKNGFEWIGNASFQMEVNSYENKVMVKHLNGEPL
jgi:ribosomal protein S18 acetylase RimI-like enzyme